MADEKISTQSPEIPDEAAQKHVSPAEPGAPRPRRVYESNLLPQRKRRRVSPWIVIPALFVILGGLFYLLAGAPRRQRHIDTAGKIVYASDAGAPGVFHLWIANLDGGGARRITTGSASDTSPVFSPDGSQIAFLSNRTGNVDQVFTADADGGNLTQLTRNTGAKAMPQFAPSDNSLLAYTTEGILATTSLSSSDTNLLLPSTALKGHTASSDISQSSTPTVISSFAWSPTKERTAQALAAVEENNGVQTLAIVPQFGKDAVETRSTPGGPLPLAAADAMSLAWSPDSSAVAVAMLGIKGFPGGSASGIILFDHQGQPLPRAPVALVKGNVTGPQNPVYSPDGSQLLFQLISQPDLAHRKTIGLFLAPLDGTNNIRALFRGPAENAQFTADGAAVLFLVRRPDSKCDLYRINVDGSGLQRLSDGQSDIHDIVVSPQMPR